MHLNWSRFQYWHGKTSLYSRNAWHQLWFRTLCDKPAYTTWQKEYQPFSIKPKYQLNKHTFEWPNTGTPLRFNYDGTNILIHYMN